MVHSTYSWLNIWLPLAELGSTEPSLTTTDLKYIGTARCLVKIPKYMTSEDQNHYVHS